VASLRGRPPKRPFLAAVFAFLALFANPPARPFRLRARVTKASIAFGVSSFFIVTARVKTQAAAVNDNHFAAETAPATAARTTRSNNSTTFVALVSWPRAPSVTPWVFSVCVVRNLASSLRPSKKVRARIVVVTVSPSRSTVCELVNVEQLQDRARTAERTRLFP